MEYLGPLFYFYQSIYYLAIAILNPILMVCSFLNKRLNPLVQITFHQKSLTLSLQLCFLQKLLFYNRQTYPLIFRKNQPVD